LRKYCSILSAPLLMMLVVISALSPRSQAQIFVQNRIASAVESSNMEPMRGTIHPLARPEFEQGTVDTAKALQGMKIHFQRTEAQEADLQSLLQAQQTKGSADYHKWLTPAQFGQRFGMSASDLAAVSAWLKQEGFTVTGVSQSRNSISFNGNVAAAERAFQTQIHNYVINGETHFANSTQISLPAALAGVVSHVGGLNDFRLKPRMQPAKNRAVNAHFTGGINGQHFLTPGDIATIYDINPLYQAGSTGKGVTIAVIAQTDIVASDITDFRAAAGLSVNNPTVVTDPTGGTPLTAPAGAASGDLAETDLDLEYSGGLAPDASIVLVNSGDVFTSLEYAIQNQINSITIPIISLSYGGCEANQGSGTITALEADLAQANTQGQTIFLASGDTGAADCDSSTNPNNPIQSATQGLAVDYPGSSAYVTDVGGTEFMGDGTIANPQTGAGTYWSATGGGTAADDLVVSAKSYIPEMAWNDTSFSISQGGGFSGTGGGVSQLFNKPSWQTGVAGIPADGKRDVPDISLDASPNHDSYLYCTQVNTVTTGQGAFASSCQATSFRVSDPGQSDDQSFLALAGGTSFAAPELAGILAVIEQKLGTTGGLGNINPTLYTLAANANSYAAAFHDVTTGNNQVPCTAGSTDCAATGSNNVIGYTAGTGYDQVTGLGSVDVNNLATAFGTSNLLVATTTAITFAPASPVTGTPVTFTATVKPRTGSATLTGTVTFTVDGNAATPSTLTAGVATYSQNFSTGGPHVVTAFYSGDAASFSSTATTTVNVMATGTAVTTTTVTANPTSLALAGSITLTATVNSATAGTVAGTVTFTIGSTTVGSAPIVAGASGVGTATLSTTATAAKGFATGTNSIVGTYGGDTTYAGSASSPVAVTVTNPSFTIAATNVTISSPSPGNTGTSTITLTSTGGYTGTVQVSASGSVNLNYGFGSSGASTVNVPLTAGGTGSTTITLTTTTATGNLQKGSKANLKKTIAAAGGTLAGCLLLLLIPGIRKKKWPVALAMLVFLSVGAGLGCGGGTGGGAPSGTYTITITGVDSSNTAITASTTFTVTIN
jgi:Pro-kumamolisin, activation domain/Bacterial Ig-like domain (group 3)